MTLVIEQLLNGLQLSILLFLLAAGLTLIFGIMGIINLAHGSMYMIGAYIGALTANATGWFLLGALAGIAAAGLLGLILEVTVMRQLYVRDHLDQVLATFALILIFNQLTSIVFGRQPLFVTIPPLLEGSIQILPGLYYPVFRLVVIGLGLLAALGLFLLINRTKVGMLIRAGATNREMVRVLGVRIALLYTLVFGLGACLAGLAGVMAGPILSVQIGMGEQILITSFVVVVIGGLGSVSGALVGALMVGFTDTFVRAFVPGMLRAMMSSSEADALGAALSSIAIYVLMAIVLLLRPRALTPGRL